MRADLRICLLVMNRLAPSLMTSKQTWCEAIADKQTHLQVSNLICRTVFPPAQFSQEHKMKLSQLLHLLAMTVPQTPVRIQLYVDIWNTQGAHGMEQELARIGGFVYRDAEAQELFRKWHKHFIPLCIM